MIQKLSDYDFNIINSRLRENYGNTDDNSHFRLVWADDETEWRWTNFTKEGIQLIHPEERKMRKYPDIRERYVLEWLRVDYDFTSTKDDGRPVEKLVYAACWTFEVLNELKEKEFIAPNYGACKFVVEVVLENIRVGGAYTKYEDPEMNSEQAQDLKEQRVKGLIEDLFGNETGITDALSIRQGVAYGQGSSPNSTVIKRDI